MVCRLFFILATSCFCCEMKYWVSEFPPPPKSTQNLLTHQAVSSEGCAFPSWETFEQSTSAYPELALVGPPVLDRSTEEHAIYPLCRRCRFWMYLLWNSFLFLTYWLCCWCKLLFIVLKQILRWSEAFSWLPWVAFTSFSSASSSWQSCCWNTDDMSTLCFWWAPHSFNNSPVV